MGLRYEELDEETCRLVVEEFDMNVANDRIFRSSYLNQRAQGDRPDMLRDAALNGTDATLAAALRTTRAINANTTRQLADGRVISAKVPHNAAEVRHDVRGLPRQERTTRFAHLGAR